MNIEPKHLDALQSLGYTEPEARFLYIVATHSGYFVARQFLAFHGAHWGKRAAVFWSKLERQKHARIERFPKSGAIYHLFSRRLYRQIDEENVRNRRAHELDFVKRRIAMLDFVLANQQYDYLETEQQKVAHFRERLGVHPGCLPAPLYLSRSTSRSSVRYFVDKFPMFLASPSHVVTFIYLHDGRIGYVDFVVHLETYLPLFRQLSGFQMLYVSRTNVPFAKATEIYDSLVRIPLESGIAADLLRYFRVRKAWDDKQYATVTDAELIFRNEARSRFKGETFEQLYRNWRYGQVSSSAIEQKFATSDRSRSVSFQTHQLGQIQVPAGEPNESGADGKNCSLQSRN
jgi:hypothetical protein